MRCFIARSKLKVCFFFLVLFYVFSQTSFCEEGDSSRVGSPQDSQNPGGNSFDETTPIDISPSPHNTRTTRNVDIASGKNTSSVRSNGEGQDEFRLETASQELSYTSHVFRLILSLAFVLGLVYVVLRFIRPGRLFSANNDPYLKLVANLNIEQGKSIKVVTIGDKAYLVGVTGNNITKIAELDDKVLVDAMKLKAEGEEEHDGSSFTKVFSAFFPIKKSKNEEQNKETFNRTFGESLNDNLFKSQQERLQNISFQDERREGDE